MMWEKSLSAADRKNWGLMQLWVAAHVIWQTATITQALTCEVGPCVVSISDFDVAWKGQKHVQADLRSLQPLLKLQPFSIMAYTFKPMPGQVDRAECESSSQQKVHFMCAPVELMRINVNYSLQKWEAISPKVLYWTKGRMEPSRVEKIRGNNAFSLTLLTLHWIPLFTTARQNLLPIIIILLQLIFSSGPWIYSLRLSLWKYFPGLWCVLTFLIYFSYLLALRTPEEEEKERIQSSFSVRSEPRVVYVWHPLKKINYETKLNLRLLRGEMLQTKQDYRYKNTSFFSFFPALIFHTSVTTWGLNDTTLHFMSLCINKKKAKC